MNTKIELTLKKLEDQRLIGNFDFIVDTSLVAEYQKVYGLGRESSGNRKLNFKLAALNLLKYKNQYFPANRIREGWVYVVSNEHHPYLKIGKSISVKERLDTMQTYCPTRSFKIEHYLFSPNALKVEHKLHTLFADSRQQGEWFNVPLDVVLEELKRMCDVTA